MNLHRLGVISSLAAADVRHEWRMSLCMMLAVMAIATPLLLFFGLKYGVIETLRGRLLDNPQSLEIMPVSEKRLDKKWFEDKRQDLRVAFVVPHTRRLSAQAEFLKKDSKTKVLLDLSPTLEGDTLLARYEVPVPQKGECVLSDQAASKIKAKVNDQLNCSVSRDRGKVKAEHFFKVVGILPPAAGTVPQVYLRLEELENIEQFKDGRAVPDWGWPGSDPLAYPLTPKALLSLANPLDAVSEALLTQNTGFSKVSKDQNFPWLETLGIPKSFTNYLLETVGNQADARDLKVLADRVRGKFFYLLPLNLNLNLTLEAQSQTLNFKLLPACALNKTLPKVNLPLNIQDLDFSTKPAPRFLIVPSEVFKSLGSDQAQAIVSLELRDENQANLKREIKFQVKLFPLENLDPGLALAHPRLLGQLGLLAERPLYDGSSTEGEKAFLLGRRGYTGFRMYAKDLELVSSLEKSLEAEGLNVKTRSDRIAEILTLDHYLDLLFWLIATASLLGGMGCLISNVYANVERKRRELAVLRLIGIHGASLTIFPLTQALLLTLGGLSASLILFHSLALAINAFFSQHLGSQEFFCRLTLSHQLTTLGLALGLALLTGIAASWRMLKIEPAESLRDE
ncbi:MAG: ABC transporter permease [Desulfovibrionaceae bacterium]|nr:ABC transporter permease [Desulfovibrionaceae bacterium]